MITNRHKFKAKSAYPSHYERSDTVIEHGEIIIDDFVGQIGDLAHLQRTGDYGSLSGEATVELTTSVADRLSVLRSTLYSQGHTFTMSLDADGTSGCVLLNYRMDYPYTHYPQAPSRLVNFNAPTGRGDATETSIRHLSWDVNSNEAEAVF
jgi:hypothetical protein